MPPRHDRGALSRNAQFIPAAGQLRVRVTLECGHVVKARNYPLQRTKYGCTAGTGCGYNLWWASAEEDGRVSRNLAYEAHRNKEGTT